MKRFLLVTLAALSLIAGCATQPGAVQKSPAEVAAAVCPQVNNTLLSLGALALEPKAAADLAAAGEVVKLVCSAGAKVEFDGLQTMANSALPLILGTIKEAGLEAAEQNRLVLDVTAANLILNGAIQSAQAAGVPVK
jgi:uncharacterized lipoprotein YajG